MAVAPLAFRVTTSEAPQSAVTPGQVASPYADLAGALDKTGEALNQIAEPLAEKAGYEAGANPVINADGTRQQAQAPIAGPASVAFARAARFTELNRITPDVENKMSEMRLAHPNDPAGFQTAASEYTRSLVGQINDPTLRGAVEKTAMDAAGANFRASIASTDQTNLTNLMTTTQARLTDINDRSTALARQGLTGTQQYAELHQARVILYNELVADPRTGFTAERAKLELKDNQDRDVVQTAIGHVVRNASTEAEARKQLDETFWGKGSERLGLTPQKRDAAINEGVAAFNNKNAEDTAETAAFRSTVSDYVSQLQKAPRNFDDLTHNAMVTQATQHNDQRSLSTLMAAKTLQPLWQAVGYMPVAERGAAIAQMSRGIVPTNAAGDAMQFFTERGYSREQASGIVGNLLHESGLNPTAVGDQEISHGIAQWNRERLTALKDFAASKGKPATDFRTQLEFVDHELQTSENGTMLALKGARTAQDAATAFIGFERPLGWTAGAPQAGHGYANRVANAQALATGDASAIRPGASIWNNDATVQKLFFSTVNTLRAQQEAAATHLADDLIDRSKNRQQPYPSQISDFITAATSANRPDLIEKAKPALLSFDAASNLMNGGVVATDYGVWPTDQSQDAAAVASQARAGAAGGAGLIERHVLTNIANGVQQSQKALVNDPLGEAANLGWIKPTGVLVTSDPSMAASEFADRNRKISIVQQRNKAIGGVKAIGDDEAEGVRTALTRGDPAVASGFLQAMAAGLSQDNYVATVSSPPIAAAITGMVNSPDGKRMQAGMAAVDKLWQADPAAAEAAFKGAIDKLHSWQGLKDSFSADEIAQNLNLARDPGVGEAREKARKAALTETDSLTPSDMAYRMGTSWGIPIVSRVANAFTGATPAVPFDPKMGDSIVFEYRQAYAALRADNVEPDSAATLALQRLKSSWGVSQAAGNQLMKNPPEMSPQYPAIGGSKDWIAEDLKDWVSKRAGMPEFVPQMRSAEAGFAFAQQQRNWSLAGLVADSRTEAEISAGRPPSYQVAIRRADGTHDFLNFQRVRFDPTEHIASHVQNLQKQAKSIDVMRFAHGGDKPAYLFGDALPE